MCWTRPASSPGAVAARFSGLDEPAVSDGPPFKKSLSIDHARQPEVIIAYAMNGKPLPLLNGYPIRLVVPGLVFDLLDQDAERHRTAGRAGRQLLDEDRLSDSRQPSMRT